MTPLHQVSFASPIKIHTGRLDEIFNTDKAAALIVKEQEVMDNAHLFQLILLLLYLLMLF